MIRHPINLGMGAALKTGYALAQSWGADIIVQLDADGEHDPDDIPKILEPLLNGEADLVIGSRFLEGSPTVLSLTRRAGIRLFTWLANRLEGLKLTDVTSGFKAFNASIVEKITYQADAHYALEMTLLAGRHRVNVREVPIRARIRKSGESQFHNVVVFFLYPLRALKQIVNVYL